MVYIYKEDLEQFFKEKYISNRFESWQSFKEYKDEVLYIYKQVLSGERNFPPYFWVGADGIINVRIVLDYALELMGISIDDIPKYTLEQILHENKLAGILRYYRGKGKYDFFNTIYQDKFTREDFRKKSIYEDIDYAKNLIRKEIINMGYKPEDLYNLKLNQWLYNNSKMLRAVKLAFNNNIIEALNNAFEGEFVFEKFRFKTLRKQFVDEDFYKMIDYILKRDNKTINELWRNDLREFRVLLPNERFRDIKDVREFYKNYKK